MAQSPSVQQQFGDRGKEATNEDKLEIDEDNSETERMHEAMVNKLLHSNESLSRLNTNLVKFMPLNELQKINPWIDLPLNT